MTLLLLWMGCAEPEPAEGQWLPGDLHVHSSVGSNDTDGLGVVEALGPAMERAGLEWVVLTDHSNCTGSMHCNDVEDCPNQGPEGTPGEWPEGVYRGSELSPVAALGAPSEPTGHIGCVARDGHSFPGLSAFVDRPTGEVSGGAAIEQCQQAGGFAILNHPFGPAPWVAYDWTSDAYEAIEVYNGGARFDATDLQALLQWEQERAAGRSVGLVGGSDSHRWGQLDPDDLLHPPLGWPTTWVHVREGEGPLDALFAGRVVVAEPGSWIDFSAVSRRSAVGPGERIRGPATLRLSAQATESGVQLELRQIGVGEVQNWEINRSLEVEVEVDEGEYYARIFPAGDAMLLRQGGVAIASPIIVE